MWPYPWTHVGTPSHLGHMDRVAATMPSQAHAGAAQEAPDIGQWEGQDVPLVRPSSCNIKGGIPSSRRYLPTLVQHVETLAAKRQARVGQLRTYIRWLYSDKCPDNVGKYDLGTPSQCAKVLPFWVFMECAVRTGCS